MGEDRICHACKQNIIWGEPDPCLGTLSGVKNACCGHGSPTDAYVQFESGPTIRGMYGFDHVPMGDPGPPRLVVRCSAHGPMMSTPNPWEPFPGQLSVQCPECAKSTVPERQPEND